MLLFVTRTKEPFFMRPFASWQLFSAIVGTQAVAVLMCGFGLLVPALPWYLIGWTWAYIVCWMIVQDVFKLYIQALLEHRTTHQRSFLHAANKPLHSHPLH